MSVLAVAKHRRGKLRDVSLELLTVGRELADATGGALHVAVVGGDVDGFTERLNRDGVDAVHTVDYGEEFNHDVSVRAVEQVVSAVDPTYVLAPNSVNGLDYVPALTQRLGWPLVTDAIAVDAEEGLTVTREQYGGKTEGPIQVAGERAVLTVRGGEWPAAEGAGDAEVSVFNASIDESAVRSTVTGFYEVGADDVDIGDADVVVSVGRGIEEEDNLDIIHDLAEALGATVSASRSTVDNGWLPKDRQVGQSGKVVTPDVYIAIGISGAGQYVAGMKATETIVAITEDPSVPIFAIADYGIVDDLFEVVPALTEESAGGLKPFQRSVLPRRMREESKVREQYEFLQEQLDSKEVQNKSIRQLFTYYRRALGWVLEEECSKRVSGVTRGRRAEVCPRARPGPSLPYR